MSDLFPDPFAGLSRLLGHDAMRVRRVVAMFYRSTCRDLVALEHAAAHGDWPGVRQFAQRIALGCAQVEAHAAAQGLAPLLEVHGDVAARAIFFGVYGRHRWRLLGTLEAAADHVFGGAARAAEGTAG